MQTSILPGGRYSQRGEKLCSCGRSGSAFRGCDAGTAPENFREVMRRQEEKIDPVRSKFGKIEKEEVPLPDKLLYVETYARTHKNSVFVCFLKNREARCILW